jgi:hypothetical protein
LTYKLVQRYIIIKIKKEIFFSKVRYVIKIDNFYNTMNQITR